MHDDWCISGYLNGCFFYRTLAMSWVLTTFSHLDAIRIFKYAWFDEANWWTQLKRDSFRSSSRMHFLIPWIFVPALEVAIISYCKNTIFSRKFPMCPVSVSLLVHDIYTTSTLPETEIRKCWMFSMSLSVQYKSYRLIWKRSAVYSEGKCNWLQLDGQMWKIGLPFCDLSVGLRL